MSLYAYLHFAEGFDVSFHYFLSWALRFITLFFHFLLDLRRFRFLFSLRHAAAATPYAYFSPYALPLRHGWCQLYHLLFSLIVFNTLRHYVYFILAYASSLIFTPDTCLDDIRLLRRHYALAVDIFAITPHAIAASIIYAMMLPLPLLIYLPFTPPHCRLRLIDYAAYLRHARFSLLHCLFHFLLTLLFTLTDAMLTLCAMFFFFSCYDTPATRIILKMLAATAWCRHYIPLAMPFIYAVFTLMLMLRRRRCRWCLRRWCWLRHWFTPYWCRCRWHYAASAIIITLIYFDWFRHDAITLPSATMLHCCHWWCRLRFAMMLYFLRCFLFLLALI